MAVGGGSGMPLCIEAPAVQSESIVRTGTWWLWLSKVFHDGLIYRRSHDKLYKGPLTHWPFIIQCYTVSPDVLVISLWSSLWSTWDCQS